MGRILACVNWLMSKVTQLSMGPKANLWKAVKVAKNQCLAAVFIK